MAAVLADFQQALASLGFLEKSTFLTGGRTFLAVAGTRLPSIHGGAICLFTLCRAGFAIRRR
jgi:hypothetical protein